MARHGIYAVSHDGTLISGCQSNQFEMGENELVQGADGLLNPKFVTLMGADPIVKFSTVDIASALDVAGFTGAAFSTNLILFFQKWVDGGTRAGATSHVKLNCTTGLMVPRRLTARQGQPASIEYDCVLISSDGLAHPLAVAANQSLAGTPDLAAMFTLGPASINGTSLSDVQSLEVEFGITLQVARGEGHVYPTAVYMVSQQPSIMVATKDPSVLDTYKGGVAQGSTDSTFFLRKLAEDGSRVAEGTAEHISMTVDAGRISLQNAGGDEGDSADMSLKVTPTYDGSNDIIALDTAAAIS